MPFECPKCKSPVAREGQRFCYRCGQELGAYYDSLKIRVEELQPPPSQPSDANAEAAAGAAPKLPSSTVVLDANAFGNKVGPPSQAEPRALLKILLPTGDVFDRELGIAETQIGKGPRNDIVIADPAVSSAHAIIRAQGGGYSISDIGSRNGTFVNGERVDASRELKHGDVIGVGLSKLTFRLADYSETGAIPASQLAAAKTAGPPPLTQDSLAAAVVEAGLVKKSEVDRLRGDGSGRRLYRALVEEHVVGEETLRDLMSRIFQIPVLDLQAVKLDDAVAADFPAKLARQYHVFACAREGEALVLAVADPTDTSAVEAIKRELGCELNVRLATASHIRAEIDSHYAPRLIGVLPSGEKLEYPIDKHEVEIGKAPHNHIVLTDPTVSNTHAIVLRREGGGHNIVDLGSRNGTFVNGDRLGSEARALRHGDKVQLGQTVLTFRNPGEAAANVTAVLSSEAVEAVRKRARILSEPEKVEPALPAVEAAVPALAATGGIEPSPIEGESTQTKSEAGDDDKGDKKKKKKKKKGKDERLKAAYISALSRVLAQVIAVVLGVMLAIYVGSTMRSGGEKPVVETTSKGKVKIKPPGAGSGVPFTGGSYEASGVAFVPGTNGVLFVDDNKGDQVFWMQLDDTGRQVGPVKPIALGTSVEDPEGITFDGTFFYVIGSESKSGGRNALVRFVFDATTQTAQKAEALTNLRDFLIANLPELKGEGEKKGNEGGLNIEGIAWDFKRARWLVGLRSPLTKDSQALVVAIRLKNPAGAFSADNLQLAEARAIALPLGGLGIRDIQFDAEVNLFLIIAGAPEHHEKTEFTLWEWDGSVDQPPGEAALKRGADLDPRLKPEGVTHVEIAGKKFVFVVGDASGYFKLDYAEAQ